MRVRRSGPVSIRSHFAPLPLAVAIVLIAACGSSSEGITTTANSDSSATAEQPAPTEAPRAEEAPPATEANPVDSMMQSDDEVRALQAQWQQAGIADYHYTGHLFAMDLAAMEEATTECGSSGGLVAVWVADGEVVEGQMSEAACVVDLASPTRLPLTGDELFERTILLMDETFGARVEVNEVGFPTSIFTESRMGVIEFRVDTFSGGVGTPGAAADEPARLQRAQDQWQRAAYDDYLIEVERTCRCAPPYRGPFEVRVEGGSTAATVNGEPIPDDLSPDSFSVEGLFAAIEQWQGADRLQVVYDLQRGIPLSSNVDPASGTADDEVSLLVTRFDPGGGSGSVNVIDLDLALRDLESDVDSAPEGVLELGDATFCGLDEVALNSELIGGDPISRSCFSSRANRGEAAVLIQRSPTTEGDPIIRVFKVNADGVTTVYVDNSQDEFGSGGWTTRTCEQLVPRTDIGPNFFTC